VVVARLLDGQGGLVGDRDGQRQWVLGELARGIVAGHDVAGRAVRVEYSTPSVSCRPFIGTQMTSRIPKRTMLWPVLKRSSCVASETSTPCFSRRTMFHDGPADRQLFVGLFVLAPAQRFGLDLSGVGVAHHDAAAVCFDGAEDQFQDAVQKLIDIENVADRLAGLVHKCPGSRARS